MELEDIGYVEIKGIKFYFVTEDTPQSVLNKIGYENAAKVPYTIEETKLLT